MTYNKKLGQASLAMLALAGVLEKQKSDDPPRLYQVQLIVNTFMKCLFLLGIGLVAFVFTQYALYGALTIPSEGKTLKAVERMAPKAFDKTMVAFMAEYRRGLPQIIDEAVTLQLADYADGVVTYTYSIFVDVGTPEDLIDAMMMDISKDHAAFNCRDNLRRTWLEKGIKIIHHYNVDGLANYSATITADDCVVRTLL